MKRKTHGKNIALKIVIGIIIFILIAAGAGLCFYHFYFKPQIAEPLQNITGRGDNSSSPSFSMTKLLEELETVLQEDDVKEYINSSNPGQTDELIDMIEAAKTRSQQKDAPSASPAPSESASVPSSAPTPPPSQKPSSGSSGNTYDKVKDQVEPKDLTDALSLAGKVDAGYILGLLSGGLTPQEKTELKKYLMGRLSSSEISRGIQLFTKYSYLM